MLSVDRYFRANGKFSFVKWVKVYAMLLIFGFILVTVVGYFRDRDETMKIEKIDHQIEENKSFKKISDYLVFKKHAEILHESPIEDYSLTFYQIRYVLTYSETNPNKYAIIEFWYKNTAPDYLMDSLHVLEVSEKPNIFTKWKLKSRNLPKYKEYEED